mmetsp:Transcript_5411/g.16380  ORF Transcript_5411/g.16380 Transcript_5411/m.16380 type:complete len:221 (+) Transcript_5411:310-972(+)
MQKLQKRPGQKCQAALVLENVASMTRKITAEFDRKITLSWLPRYVIDESIFGGAPRLRYYWTNLPQRPLALPKGSGQSLNGWLTSLGSAAVSAFPGQTLATVRTTPTRPPRDAAPADWANFMQQAHYANYVSVSREHQQLRPLHLFEMAATLNLAPLYPYNCNASEGRLRHALGNTFGIGSCAYILSALATAGCPLREATDPLPPTPLKFDRDSLDLLRQ